MTSYSEWSKNSNADEFDDDEGACSPSTKEAQREEIAKLTAVFLAKGNTSSDVTDEVAERMKIAGKYLHYKLHNNIITEGQAAHAGHNRMLQITIELENGKNALLIARCDNISGFKKGEEVSLLSEKKQAVINDEEQTVYWAQAYESLRKTNTAITRIANSAPKVKAP